MGDKLIGRRELIELIGGVAFLAACGGTSSKTGTPGATGATTSTGASGSTAAGPPTTVTLNGAAEPVAKQITRASLTRFRDLYTGKWSGAWVEEGGRKGTAEAAIAIDVVRRVATCTVSFDGPLLGGPTPKPTTYVVGIDQYDATSEHAVVVTPQLGRIDVTIEGFGHVRLRATQIPGHRDISSVDITAVFERPTAGDITYTINKTDGTTQRGALAAAKGSTRPAYPSLDQATSVTAFVSGDYAASLITAAAASRFLGQPCKTPIANGGRIEYAPGIDVSNCRVETVADNLKAGAVIQYSIYRAPDAAAMRTFFEQYNGYRVVPNVGEAAMAFPPGTTPITILDARKGRYSLDLSIVGGESYQRPPDAQNTALFVAVARAILAKLP